MVENVTRYCHKMSTWILKTQSIFPNLKYLSIPYKILRVSCIMCIANVIAIMIVDSKDITPEQFGSLRISHNYLTMPNWPSMKFSEHGEHGVILTLMLEKTVPLRTMNIRGSRVTILLGERNAQMVLTIARKNSGTIGRNASPNGRIFPVLSRYDLHG